MVVVTGRRALLLGSLAVVAWRLYKRIVSRTSFDGLNNIVGWSAKVIAAARALEGERQDALVNDPFATILAGPTALRRMREANASRATNSDDARPVGRLIMRTVFCDDTVLSATGQSQRMMTSGLKDTWAAAGRQGCTQVVLLGAGMDTRAWRLDLPPNTIKWFEVDQGSVLVHKRSILSKAGAQFQPPSSSPDHQPATSDTSGAAHVPLRAASYAAVPADLQVRGWSAALMAAGFSASQRTLWVLEGLLYYLDQDTVPGLLQEMSDVSAEGSWMVASCVSRSVTDRVRKNSKSVTSAWKWGAPGTVDEWPAYFAASGWATSSIEHWIDIAHEYGLTAHDDTPAAAKDSKLVAPDASKHGNVGTAPGPAAADATPSRRKTFGMVLAVKA